MKLRAFLSNWQKFHSKNFSTMLASPGRKSILRQIFEASSLLRYYRHPPIQYINHGLYLRTAPASWRTHIPHAFIRNLRNKLNPVDARKFSEDKRLFRQRIESAGLPVVRELFFLDADGIIRDADEKLIEPFEAAARLRAGEFFAKPTDGIHGEGAQLLRPNSDHEAFLHTARNVIVQPRIRQHPLLAQLYPYSINTVRIDTLLMDDACISNAAILRLGVGGSITDNNATGGIVVGIELETGKLKREGRQKPQFSCEVHLSHPDTGVVFEGLTLPHWDLLRETVGRAAHAMLPLRTLGWDVVITEEGVLLLETNHDWGSASLQMGWGGLADTSVGQMACELHGLRVKISSEQIVKSQASAY